MAFINAFFLQSLHAPVNQLLTDPAVPVPGTHRNMIDKTSSPIVSAENGSDDVPLHFVHIA